MAKLTESLKFAEVYRVLEEGNVEEIAAMQAQIAQIDTQLQQRTKSLMDRKNRLAALLAQKQKQLAAQQQRQPAAQPTTAQPAPQQ